MLILSRRHGESLKIGDEVTVTIVAINYNRVRIGITAPKHIEVHREEIYERILREKGAQGRREPDEEAGAEEPRQPPELVGLNLRRLPG